MTRTLISSVIAALALTVSGCAHTSAGSSHSVAYAPSGQAAQPWAWNGSEQHIAKSQGVAAGRDAQPWSGPSATPERAASRQFAASAPSGRAGQPSGWLRNLQ